MQDEKVSDLLKDWEMEELEYYFVRKYAYIAIDILNFSDASTHT